MAEGHELPRRAEETLCPSSLKTLSIGLARVELTTSCIWQPSAQ